jgi:putative transposase
MLQERFRMSERRACRIVGQHRSTQRHKVTRGKGDDALRKRLHEFSRKHKRWATARRMPSS